MADSTQAALLIGNGAPLVLLNRFLVGTTREWPALSWALRRIASAPAAGLYLRIA